jgi:SAM-dependent methyltransferase
MTWAYDSLYIHRAMLLDKMLNEAYQRAIAEAVRPGDTVLDIGAGAGILSLLAARAGAGRVFAVEKTSIARVARRMVAHNGAADRVQVLEGDIQAVSLPAKVDVIVSEWLGTLGVDENLLYPLLVARDRWLKPQGRMLSRRVTACIAPISHRQLNADTTYLRAQPLDVDLGPIADATSHEMMWPQDPIASEELLARAAADVDDGCGAVSGGVGEVAVSRGTALHAGLCGKAERPGRVVPCGVRQGRRADQRARCAGNALEAICAAVAAPADGRGGNAGRRRVHLHSGWSWLLSTRVVRPRGGRAVGGPRHAITDVLVVRPADPAGKMDTRRMEAG